MPTNNKSVRLSEVVGGGYDDFWRCHKRYRVLKGGKGSKKSATTALWYIYHMMKYAGSNLLVVRRVMDTNRSSTFAQLQWAINRLGVGHLWRATKAPIELCYTPTGQRVLFRGFDDALKLASTTVDSGYLCWVWIEEAFELPLESDFDKLDLSMPRGNVPAPLFKQTTLTFNPWSEHHWLKARFFDHPRDDTATYTTNYMCNEFLDDADKAVMERLKADNPRQYRVAGLGDWGISDGLIYDKWTVDSFDINAILDGENGWRYACLFGLDYGYTNDPTAFIALAVNKEDKLLYIFDEHYQRRMLNDEIAQMIIDKGYAKERIRADSAEPKSNDDLRRHGISRIQPAAKGKDSIAHGIAQLQEYQMVVHTSCVNTIAELSSYCWSTSKDGSGINKPVDRDNHLMDAMRYAMTDISRVHCMDAEQAKAQRRAARRAAFDSGMITDDFAGGWDG